MTVSVTQLECPRCGHRFELSETFRAHYEQEKRTAVDGALRRANAKAEAALTEREEAIRAEAQAQHERQLAEIAQREETLQAQLQANQAAQAGREAQIRAEAVTDAQAQLADSAQREESLQTQLLQQQAAQEELQENLAKEQAEREEREAEIRQQAEEAARAQLDEATKRGEDLQAQLQKIQTAHTKREEAIRTEAAAAAQAQLADSAQREESLQTQLRQQQAAQEELQENLAKEQAEREEREAEIRQQAEEAARAQLDEATKREQSLQAQLQQEQADRAQQEAFIRADEEAKAEERYALQRQQDAIEKQRLERAAAEAQAKVADMQRQLGQGSVELQGEALEVYLKRQLQAQFPFDQIEDIGRGQLGADLTQAVFDGQLGACGIVVWEAKRTKHWNDDWLDKIKSDADRVGSQVRVIVSEALPPEIHVFALKEGVWVSSVEGALPLATALRAQLVESARLQRAGQGKGLKMDEIYNYLTSPRFGERIQRMVETWQALEEQIASEERAMRRQWSERRKQLARMRETTTEMFTDFSAILGREIAQVPGLELEALPPAEEAGAIDPSLDW